MPHHMFSFRPLLGLYCFALAAGGVLSDPAAGAVEVLGKRFDPPRLYFTQASLNKSGTVSAIHRQDNFLRLFMPAIEAPADRYAADAFTFTLELPAGVMMLTGGTVQVRTQPTDQGIKVTGSMIASEVENRCIGNTWSADVVLWIRVDDLPADSTHPIRITLEHRGEALFTDEAKLRVYGELIAPPRVDPRHFRFWLHYGPFHRTGEWDALADYLRRAGINAIQIMAWNMEKLQAMRQRDFYVIAQRGGSYGQLHADHQGMANLNRAQDMGPAWFEEQDGGQMLKAQPHAHAVIWDFEPSPGHIVTDADTLRRFRAAANIATDEPLDEATIKQKYYAQWHEFRQNQFAAAVIAWADWSRSITPGIETILTEGRCNIFDPLSQTDYRKVAEHVDFCDPMNFAGLNAIHGMQKWKAAAPTAQFMGCQNVAYSQHSPVFISANTIMLQIVSAALMGNAGTNLYPGQTMDAENYIAFNRVMGFLGRHQAIIWGGHVQPRELLLTLLPKEDSEIRLGDGRVIRNTFPDWSRDAVWRTYRDDDGEAYLVAVANWNAVEPCFGRLQVQNLHGDWMLVDAENARVYTLDGRESIDAARLAQGVIVRAPATDYRGFRLQRHDSGVIAGHERVALEDIERDYNAYAATEGPDGGAAEQGDVLFGYDDIDGDNLFEYRVTTPAQTVWISQAGHIVRWQASDAVLNTDGFGLCRDQLWLPVGERGNTALDATMALETRRAQGDVAELALARSVSLDSLGAMVDIRLTRRFRIHRTRPEIAVEVDLHNTSLSMEVSNVQLSYRVHNHLRYTADTNVWIDDGSVLTTLGTARDMSVPGIGLDSAAAELVFGQYRSHQPIRLAAFGEHQPDTGLLLSIVPDQPDALLQLLRWLNHDGRSGTIEWMYRPVELGSGQRWVTSYHMSLQGGVKTLDRPAVTAVMPQAAGADAQGRLLFHADFHDRADAAVAAGSPKATVTGMAVYEDTPTGRGLRISGDTQVDYLPEGNIDLARGRAMVRFKPLWDGTDDQSRLLMIVQPVAGHVYFGKIGDGRLLMNMFDARNQQHYPWAIVRDIKAGQWYEAMVTWDTARGRMALYLDGRKVAESEHEPWQMPALDNANPRCRLTIPTGAEVVIDEIRIWDRP